MSRLTIVATCVLVLSCFAVLAAPTAEASTCNRDFPGGEVLCDVYDDVNRICSNKFGHPCFL